MNETLTGLITTRTIGGLTNKELKRCRALADQLFSENPDADLIAIRDAVIDTVPVKYSAADHMAQARKRLAQYPAGNPPLNMSSPSSKLAAEMARWWCNRNRKEKMARGE